jgi:hypothetical protein
MPTDRRVIFAVLCPLFIAITCLAQSCNQKRSKVMNKKLKDSWSEAKSRVFQQNETSQTVIGSKRATFNVESEKGVVTTIPVVAFATPSGKTWMGPAQDFYIETDSGIIGFQMRVGGELFWCSSLAKNPAPKAKTPGATADPSSEFEQDVSGSDLFDAHMGIDPDARLARITDLRQNVSSWFFSDSPGSSQTGLAKIVGVEISGGQLKLDLTDQAGKYSVTVWLDIKTKRGLKATEIKEIN